MFILLEPEILLLGIDTTEIIRSTGQDSCRRKLITGLFITWKKLETTQPANSPGRRKPITNLQDITLTQDGGFGECLQTRNGAHHTVLNETRIQNT